MMMKKRRKTSKRMLHKKSILFILSDVFFKRKNDHLFQRKYSFIVFFLQKFFLSLRTVQPYYIARTDFLRRQRQTFVGGRFHLADLYAVRIKCVPTCMHASLALS